MRRKRESMNEAAFLISIRDSEKVLKDLGLLKKKNYINSNQGTYKKYSDDFLKVARTGTYFDIYRCAMENDDYDFLLEDGSFFQFSYDMEERNENIRMAYYPSICNLEYREFLMEQFGIDESECGADYIELYQQYVIEQEPENVTPMRYDFNVKLYKEIIHSAAHFHIGYEENIRIPVEKRLKPLLFTKMAIEFFYYEKWKKVINAGDEKLFYANCDMEELQTEFFTSKDKKIPYIKL